MRAASLILALLLLAPSPSCAQNCADEWLEMAMVDSFSFAFNDYEKLTSLARSMYFTPHGGKDYDGMRLRMGKALKEQMLVQQFALLEKPVLLRNTENEGIYAWTYRVSGLLTWSGVKPVMGTKPAVFEVTITRSNSNGLEYGIGIDTIEVAP